MNARALLIIATSMVACDGARDAAAPPRPAVEQPPPEPERVVDRSLGEGFELRKPIVDGRLTLVPIVATRPAPDLHYVTLAAGLTSGELVLTEANNSLIVDTLHIVNRSDRPAFVLQGELVVEGRQDRITAESMIIEPHGATDLKVRCVEHDRSSGESAFKAGNAIGELALRRAVAFETQVAVWGLVDAINRARALAPPTHTYRLAALAQTQPDARRQAILAELARREEHDRIVGFAVAIDGEVIAIDRVDAPSIMRALEPMLVASYLVDTGGVAGAHPPLTPAAIQAFAGSRLPVMTAVSATFLRERDVASQDATRYRYD